MVRVFLHFHQTFDVGLSYFLCLILPLHTDCAALVSFSTYTDAQKTAASAQGAALYSWDEFVDLVGFFPRFSAVKHLM